MWAGRGRGHASGRAGVQTRGIRVGVGVGEGGEGGDLPEGGGGGQEKGERGLPE